MKHNKQMGMCTSQAKKAKRAEQERKVKQLEREPEGIETGVKTAWVRAREFKTGAWLSVQPVEADHMHLTYEQWIDMMSLRYSKPLVNAKRYCDYHRDVPYTLHHAATCGAGGNRVYRHNTIQNAVQAIGHKVLGTQPSTWKEHLGWSIGGRGIGTGT